MTSGFGIGRSWPMGTVEEVRKYPQSLPRPQSPDAATAVTPREETALFVVAFSLVAGMIHAEAAVIHFPKIWWYGALFTLLACFQMGWAVQLYRQPSTSLLRAGIVVSLGTVAVWAISRIAGLPVGPATWKPESVGALDIAATLDELAIVALAWTLLRDSVEWIGAASMRLAVYAALTVTGVPLFLGGGPH
jgi:hypothetical protein